MPWHIEKQADKFAVVKDADNSVEGKPHDTEEQAKEHLAALYASEKKALGDLRAALYELKVGARNNRVDLANIQKIHDLAGGLGASCNPAGDKSLAADEAEGLDTAEADDVLIAQGLEVKALGEGKIGGLLVRYGAPDEPDLSAMRDWFHAQTYLGAHDGDGVDVTLNHGIPLAEGEVFEQYADRLLPPIKTRRTDLGLFAETVMNLSDEYEAMVYDLASKGKLRWSSGALNHQVKRVQMPNGTHRIDRWIIGEAALTPTPAEPRLGLVQPLKALLSARSAPDGARRPEGRSADQVNSPTDSQGDTTMDEKEIKALQDANKALEASLAELKTKLETIEKMPALNTVPAQVAPRDEKPFKALGEQLLAIHDVAIHNHTPEQANRLDAVKAYNLKASGANESVSSEGGFLVQTDFSSTIFQRAYETGVLTSRCFDITISGNANGTKINAVDEQSRADGSRWGGLRAYWAAEATAVTATKPKWRQVNLELKKLFVLFYATDEQLQDSNQLEQFVMQTVPQEMAFKLDDAILNGTGAGVPQGILNAACLVSVSKESGQAAATVLWENVKKMRGRQWSASRAKSAWFINQDVEQELYGMKMTVGVGGVPVYLPATGASGMPYDTLFGRPVIPIEQCPTLGTVGDIVLLDLSQYALAGKGGIQGAQSIHVAFTTDEMAFRWIWRNDGQPLWNTALTPYKGSNTLSPFVALATRS